MKRIQEITPNQFPEEKEKEKKLRQKRKQICSPHWGGQGLRRQKVIHFPLKSFGDITSRTAGELEKSHEELARCVRDVAGKQNEEQINLNKSMELTHNDQNQKPERREREEREYLEKKWNDLNAEVSSEHPGQKQKN